MSAPLLYPYQQRWLADTARFKVGMFARQTGKSFTTTLEIVRDCQLAEAEGRKARWVILSRGERQAKEAMDEGVKLHARALGAVIRAVDYEWRGDSSHKALEVSWPGGSRITALPANPDTARGYSASVFLDEFAFHLDSRKIWKALFPVISAGHRLRVVSTPNGKGNKFYELMTAEGSTPWSRHIVDIYQAVADGLPRDIAELRAGIGSEDDWLQEFELRWLDEASAWLPYDLINSAEELGAGDPAGYQGHPCYVGIDIAARNDLFVIWVWEKIGDVLWCREVIARQRITFAEQDHLLEEVIRRYRVVRVAMDQGGMGEKPVEDARRRYGYRVEGVIFTSATKQHLATLAKQSFEDRKVRLPIGDHAIRTDLHSLRRVVTPAGNPRFDVSMEGDGHADRAWAAFLGIYAASEGVSPIEYHSAPSPTTASDSLFLGL
jgi:phage FluMu gp28-like protein